MDRLITRRTFTKTGIVLASAAFSPVAWSASIAEASTSEGLLARTGKPRYRAVSWWLTWDDMTWPNQQLMDKIRRRADQCAASGVNCCVIFGAHLRWDFMPLWGRQIGR